MRSTGGIIEGSHDFAVPSQPWQAHTEQLVLVRVGRPG
jgi:hypothetical protein